MIDLVLLKYKIKTVNLTWNSWLKLQIVWGGYKTCRFSESKQNEFVQYLISVLYYLFDIAESNIDVWTRALIYLYLAIFLECIESFLIIISLCQTVLMQTLLRSNIFVSFKMKSKGWVSRSRNINIISNCSNGKDTTYYFWCSRCNLQLISVRD